MRIKIILLLVVFNSQAVYAQPKLFSSDWPVWNLTEGMHENGMLKDFDYRLVKYETSLNWFKAGNLDVTFMTLYDFISIQPTKVPTVILGVTDYSSGGDKIIVRKDIRDASDLKGKKILLASNTISLWLLHNYLIDKNMDFNDVVVVTQKENLAPLQFKEDESFSAVVGWNPNIDKALDNGAYVAATSSDYPRSIYDLIVAKESALKEYPEIIEEFMQNYYRGIHSQPVIDQTAISLSVSSDEFKMWLEDASIFSSRHAANNEFNHLHENAEKIIKFLTVAPDVLVDVDTRKRFRKRSLDIGKMMRFKDDEIK